MTCKSLRLSLFLYQAADKVFSCVFTTMHQWTILLGAQIPNLEKHECVVCILRECIRYVTMVHY